VYSSVVNAVVRRGRYVTALLVGLAAACGDGGQQSQPGAGMGGPGGRGAPVATVSVAQVEMGTISRVVTVSGVVEPIRVIAVNSQLAGALLSVEVQEGDAVAENAVLARIDDRELRAQLASAEAAYQVASATYERSQRLWERQVITAAEYERDRAAFAAAEAQVQQLRTRLEYATIRSPVTGVVATKHVEQGDVVGAQTRLFTIADVSTMVVRVQVSELDVVHVSPGDMANVVLDAYPDRPIVGRVRRIFPTADPTTRLVPVEVALEGEGAQLARTGFLARVSLKLNTTMQARLVPASAVLGSAGSESVFVVELGKARRRPVRTGAMSEGKVEIVSGLEVGEVVVVAGNHALRDGMDVRVVGDIPEGVPGLESAK